jgi:glycosyltransferase involved in cell wall biosynthesis
MTQPLRVLHCAAGNLYGGVETFLRTLAQTAAEHPGLAHEFAVCFEGRLAIELWDAGAEVHRLGPVRFSRPWTVWRARARLARLLDARRIDLAVTHGCWAHLLAARAARRSGRPLAFWTHDLIGGAPALERRAARVAPDLAVANSGGTAASLANLFPGVPAEVVRYPVRPPAQDLAAGRATFRTELATPQDDAVIVTACRLERWKGHALLIEALGRLRDRSGWSCWVVGGAQRPYERVYLDELKEQARGLGIGDRVRWLGLRDDVSRVLAAADIHCQPNTGAEPFGIAFVEALYAGLPVISTRLGGAAEIVIDDCGILVPPGDVGALAEALARLIDDPAARWALGMNGPARAAALCDPDRVLGRLEELFTGLRAAAAGGSSKGVEVA